MVGIDELIAGVGERVGDGRVAQGGNYGQQRYVQRLRHVPRARVVTDEQLAMGEESDQLPHRASLNPIEHAGLQGFG